MAIPFYLFKGSEFGERNDALQELKNKAKKQFPAVEFNIFFMSETSLSEIMSQFTNGSLFSDALFYVIKNAELIKKKDDIELLENWKNAVESEKNENSILVLITDENSVEKKLEKLVPKENVKMFWEMYESKKLPWVKNYFARNGFKITDEAAQAILNLVENNTEELKNECSRFFACFTEDHLIDVDDVDQILAHNKEETPFTLFDALVDTSKKQSERLEKSREILQKILSSAKSDSSIEFIAGLLYSFRQLKKWSIINENGRLGDSELMSKGFYIKSAWPQYEKACRLWSPRQIQKIISLLSDADVQLRTMAASLKEGFLQTLIYQIVMNAGNPLFEFESDDF